MPENEPLSHEDDTEETLARIIPPEAAAEYARLKQQLREALKGINTRHKRTLKRLRQRSARPAQVEELEEQKRQLIEHRKEEFRRQVRAMVEDLMGGK